MARRKVSLVRVARVYREAQQQGLPPTKTVAEVMELPYDTAAKKIANARQLHLLPSYAEAAQHRPALAVILRGGPRERRFEVCESCLTPWPCINAKEEIDSDDHD